MKLIYKIQEATNESEEMLKMQKDTSNQMHYETCAKKHDIKRELQTQTGTAKGTFSSRLKSGVQ